jgi:hypothetical protein
MIGAFLSALLALQAAVSPAVQHVHAGVNAEKSGQLDAALAEFQRKRSVSLCSKRANCRRP